MSRGLGLKGLGLASIAAGLACIAFAPRAALAGWLNAAILVQSVPLGALLLLAVMRVTRLGKDELRVTCDAGSGLWSLAFLAFVPVLVGALFLQEWPHSSVASRATGGWDEALPVTLRALLWFLALAAIARVLVGGRSSRMASFLALVVMVAGGTVIAVDWIRPGGDELAAFTLGTSLFILEVVSAGAALVLLRVACPPEPKRSGPLSGLLLVLVLLWLCSAVLLWPSFRSGGMHGPAYQEPWVLLLTLAAALVIAALLMLLLPSRRRSPRVLAWVALFMLAATVLQFAWLAVPAGGAMAVLAFLLALCGLGCQAASFLAPGDEWRFPGKRYAI
jgi:hypothetical protein